MQVQLWSMAGVSAALAVIATLADRRRQRRTDLDAVGFMPWTLITVLSVMAALVLTALALKIHE